MRRFAILSTGLLFGLAAFSQSPLDCLDPDVLRGLLMFGQGERTLVVTSTAPAELSAFKAPRAFVLVGTGERSFNMEINGARSTSSQVNAVYRTSLAVDAAREAGVAALTDGGWALAAGRPGFRPAVFLPHPLQAGETYCREGKPVTVNANALDGVTYVIFAINRSAQGLVSPCEAAAAPSFIVAAPEMDKYLPKLRLPVDPASGQLLATRGGGGGGNDEKRTFTTAFKLKASADSVARHFAAQMAEQGWIADANWSNAGTAGSTWTRRTDPDALQATLIVSAFDDDQFSVAFRAIRTK